MTREYTSLLEELIETSVQAVRRRDEKWSEVVREQVEGIVFEKDFDTHLNILKHSTPHDEWQIYCDDMSDHQKVIEAMAYVAIRQDVISYLIENDLVDAE